MPLAPQIMPPAGSSADIHDRQMELAEIRDPSAFKLRAQLLDQGRTDTPLAATEDLTLRLKVYASGGENELHAHPREDHAFIVLQGSALFYGPDGELAELGANEGLMLPRGALYRFNATSKEPLVLLRIGTPNRARQGGVSRVDRAGAEMRGDSKENRTVPVIFRDGAFFG